MKKFLFASLIGLLPGLLMAQNIVMSTTKSNTASKAAIVYSTTDNTLTNAANNDGKSAKTLRKEAKENRQFTRTAKAFSRDFDDMHDVRWSSTKREFVASFTKDNVRTLVWYSKGGNLLYTMMAYSADKLPKREQRVIHSEYDGYKIASIEEVHQNDIVVYVVHLENDSYIKLITVCDGATHMYREYKKG